uniref:Uncharacterized protein n=1 Tax=Romanomermis culicivorax TaxID=13658 RepID=A0A915ICH6_ROMCU
MIKFGHRRRKFFRRFRRRRFLDVRITGRSAFSCDSSFLDSTTVSGNLVTLELNSSNKLLTFPSRQCSSTERPFLTFNFRESTLLQCNARTVTVHRTAKVNLTGGNIPDFYDFLIN